MALSPALSGTPRLAASMLGRAKGEPTTTSESLEASRRRLAMAYRLDLCCAGSARGTPRWRCSCRALFLQPAADLIFP